MKKIKSSNPLLLHHISYSLMIFDLFLFRFLFKIQIPSEIFIKINKCRLHLHSERVQDDDKTTNT